MKFEIILDGEFFKWRRIVRPGVAYVSDTRFDTADDARRSAQILAEIYREYTPVFLPWNLITEVAR